MALDLPNFVTFHKVHHPQNGCKTTYTCFSAPLTGHKSRTISISYANVNYPSH